MGTAKAAAEAAGSGTKNKHRKARRPHRNGAACIRLSKKQPLRSGWRTNLSVMASPCQLPLARGASERLIHAVVSHGYAITVDVAPEHEMEKVLYATS